MKYFFHRMDLADAHPPMKELEEFGLLERTVRWWLKVVGDQGSLAAHLSTLFDAGPKG